LKPEQVPATALVPGQRVELVHVPVQGAADTGKASGTSPEAIEGRVVKASSAAPGTGIVVVDVATTAQEGATAAAWVSAGTLRLVLAAPGGE
jgi:hypothetical protein